MVEYWGFLRIFIISIGKRVGDKNEQDKKYDKEYKITKPYILFLRIKIRMKTFGSSWVFASALFSQLSP